MICPSGPGMFITFKGDMGSLNGSVTVRNASTGRIATRRLESYSSATACALELINAALETGLQAELEGGSEQVRICGAGNSVTVAGTFVDKKDF